MAKLSLDDQESNDPKERDILFFLLLFSVLNPGAYAEPYDLDM